MITVCCYLMVVEITVSHTSPKFHMFGYNLLGLRSGYCKVTESDSFFKIIIIFIKSFILSL